MYIYILELESLAPSTRIEGWASLHSGGTTSFPSGTVLAPSSFPAGTLVLLSVPAGLRNQFFDALEVDGLHGLPPLVVGRSHVTVFICIGGA